MHKKYILVVEDSEASGMLIKSLFEDEGNIVVEVTQSVRQAYKKLKKQMPNLILLDIMLPGTDGITMLKQLKLNDHYKNIPVIMVSAKENEKDIALARKLGAIDYVKKPIGVNHLLERSLEVLKNLETC